MFYIVTTNRIVSFRADVCVMSNIRTTSGYAGRETQNRSGPGLYNILDVHPFEWGVVTERQISIT